MDLDWSTSGPKADGRERIGFKMLRVFLEQLGSATFLEKLEMEDDVYALRFERGGRANLDDVVQWEELFWAVAGRV